MCVYSHVGYYGNVAGEMVEGGVGYGIWGMGRRKTNRWRWYASESENVCGTKRIGSDQER